MTTYSLEPGIKFQRKTKGLFDFLHSFIGEPGNQWANSCLMYSFNTVQVNCTFSANSCDPELPPLQADIAYLKVVPDELIVLGIREQTNGLNR